MWARGTSLSELLPDDAAGIVPWDDELSADAAYTLLRDGPTRERNVAAIRDRRGATHVGRDRDAIARALSRDL